MSPALNFISFFAQTPSRVACRLLLNDLVAAWNIPSNGQSSSAATRVCLVRSQCTQPCPFFRSNSIYLARSHSNSIFFLVASLSKKRCDCVVQYYLFNTENSELLWGGGRRPTVVYTTAATTTAPYESEHRSLPFHSTCNRVTRGENFCTSTFSFPPPYVRNFVLAVYTWI